ncbi:hypothetical protein ACFE04_018036 [Oxalis oulophora]
MDDYLIELEGKRVHDPFFNNWKNMSKSKSRSIWVPGPVIVGAGPSGLAVAACLKSKGVPSLILERSNCIASLWQHKTYDRLRLHLPKRFCQLPLYPFPSNYPTYPSKQQFVTYLNSYTHHFGLQPVFNTTVASAEFDPWCGFWRVKTKRDGEECNLEYICHWLIVASGENAEEVVPKIEGIGEFGGHIIHTSAYKSGEMLREKHVLVVGCGNSGMEVCLDLCDYDACPTLVVRDTVHVLPQEMLGRSTFGLSMCLLKWFPIRLVDQILLLVSRLLLGDTARFGIHRPKLGPLEFKTVSGKTPVLDVGTFAKIKSGHIKVCPGIKRLTHHSAEFVNGRLENFDAIVLATGYKSNVPSWLKVTSEIISCKDRVMPENPFPNGWKGKCGLYAVGFTKNGLPGISIDARKIAEDIAHCWKLSCARKSTASHFTREED